MRLPKPLCGSFLLTELWFADCALTARKATACRCLKEKKVMHTAKTKIMLLAALGALALAPGAFADGWNQKTVMTFSGPVEVPGQVLPAGTYVFKVADSPSARHIIQIFTKNERQILG